MNICLYVKILLRPISRNLRFKTELLITKKVKGSRYRLGVAQRVGRGIALLFHDRGTRRGWVVSSTPRPYFTPGIYPVPTLQEVGWASGPVWRGGNSRPHRDLIPERPARSQSLYRLSYRAHKLLILLLQNTITFFSVLSFLIILVSFKYTHKSGC